MSFCHKPPVKLISRGMISKNTLRYFDGTSLPRNLLLFLIIIRAGFHLEIFKGSSFQVARDLILCIVAQMCISPSTAVVLFVGPIFAVEILLQFLF
jgi:hypothetical protein